MIERKFVAQLMKEYQIEDYVGQFLDNVGHSKTKLVKTPLGEKIVVHASRPGLIVGRKGANIKQLTKMLKNKFNLENPEVEIAEVEDVNLDADIVAERIASALERFGTQRFKGVGHRIMSDVMGAGALGIEITISGKVPSSRAKTWRFYSGYLKKAGDIALTGVRKSIRQARLKTGVIGIQVSVMPPATILPDNISIITKEALQEAQEKAEAASGGKKEAKETTEAAAGYPAEVKTDESGDGAEASAGEKTPKKKKKAARKKKAAKKKTASAEKGADPEDVKKEAESPAEEPSENDDENQGDKRTDE